jgi:choline dehydrogenase-like flavoprotein
MPAVPNANLNAPVMMLAEKGADEILKAWPVGKTEA